MRWVLVIALGLPACGDDDCWDALHPPGETPDAPSVQADPGICSGPRGAKIQFTRAESCSNDGAVEWCIPIANHDELRARLRAISPTITCGTFSTLAMCPSSGRTACRYPVDYPGECIADHGEMKPDVWDNICAVAAQPEITEIVETIYFD